MDNEYYIKKRKKEYEDYLHSEKWRIKKKEALERAEYRCQLCNNNRGTLHVHHNNYDNFGNEKPNDLIVLCDKCHMIHHKRLDKKLYGFLRKIPKSNTNQSKESSWYF